ncbi:hypothetical protein ACWDBO_51990 [Streptomyces mirabilis]|jgi:hypothetical protein|nr:hypothetical protein [Streptomyces sp. AK02-04a]MDX3760835.1 hypothetical protein [Streptomyces sp. AK02-04a]
MKGRRFERLVAPGTGAKAKLTPANRIVDSQKDVTYRVDDARAT